MTASARFMLHRALLAAAGRSANVFPTNATTTTTTKIGMTTTTGTTTTATATSTLWTLDSTRRFCSVPAKQKIIEDDSSSPGLPVAADAQKYENLVAESIKKLMTSNRDIAQEEQLKPISNEDLEVRLQYFQVRTCAHARCCVANNRADRERPTRVFLIHMAAVCLFPHVPVGVSQKVFEEAELCLSDLRETLFEVDDEQYREECNCAEGALNNAFTAYIDLLEDFRRSSEEQLQAYSEERNTNANNLKRLRRELDQIIEVANNRECAST